MRPGTLTKTKILEFKDIMASCRASGIGLVKLAYVDDSNWVIRFSMVEGQEDPVTISAESTKEPGIHFRVFNFESINAFNAWVAEAPAQVQLPVWNPQDKAANRVLGAHRLVNTKDGRTLSIPA